MLICIRDAIEGMRGTSRCGGFPERHYMSCRSRPGSSLMLPGYGRCGRRLKLASRSHIAMVVHGRQVSDLMTSSGCTCSFKPGSASAHAAAA